MVLLIDHHDSFTYNLKQLIEECQSNFIDVLSYREVSPERIDCYDKIVLSPGPETPAFYSYFEWFFPHTILSKKILGICLGHQAIGFFFGAKLVNLSQVYHGLQRRIIVQKPVDTIFKDIPAAFDAGLYHSWALDKKNFPDELCLTAISDDGVVMAIKHRDHDVTGLQFHPESIMTNHGKILMRNWLNQESGE